MNYPVVVRVKIPELDGIRGLAILLVLICHISLWEPFSRARSVLFHGTIGVDLFFVLSGFLITGILLDSKEQGGAIGRFYVRRMLRIWPVYFGMLLVLFLLLRRFLPGSAAAWRYVFFVQNLSTNQQDGPLLHPFWSLAVEEQFYLVWPWVVFRLSQKKLVRLCGALFVSALLFRIAFSLFGVSEQIVYVNTLCRTDAIAIGSLLAIWARSSPGSWGIVLRYPALWASVLVLCLALGEHTLLRQFGNSFAALFFAWLVFTGWQRRGTHDLLARTLRSGVLTYLGQISFTLYVINLPIYSFAHGNSLNLFLGAGTHPVIANLLSAILGSVVCLVVAACSWRLFEKPILGLKDHFGSARPVPSFASTGD